MERTTTIRGRHVRYLDAGQGQTLLLLHAFPLSADMWRPQFDQRPEGWRLVAPDYAGFGGSERFVGEPAAVASYALDAIALLDALGVHRFVVAGLSMGGYVAFAVVRQARMRLRGLVLADTRADADSDEARANRQSMMAALDERGVAAARDAMLPKLLAEENAAAHPELVATVRAMIERNAVGGVRDAVAALMTRPDSVPLLKDIACPALVLVGERDAITPVALHEQMHAALPNATLAVIPGAGHLANLERPAAFSAALGGFLAALPPDSHA
ncbi:MAG: alpha/beta fold hydrolase [Vicinamibacteraceae bacterium]|nr:alpha/beta fold hydrolase [Vicinamibacteraceae bacterium]